MKNNVLFIMYDIKHEKKITMYCMKILMYYKAMCYCNIKRNIYCYVRARKINLYLSFHYHKSS